MYTPSAFKDEELASLHGLIEQTRLAILVSHDENGIQASHLPLLFNPGEGPFGTLYGHLAKANRQWHALHNGAEVLVVFAGADAYVSPGFYPSKAEHGKVVPTWNYQAVHVHGRAEVFSDPDRLLSLVSALTDKHESSRAVPWKVADAPADYIAKMLGAIVGFALPISSLEGKRKLSQNRSAEDIAGVRQGLIATTDARALELAKLMAS